MTKDRLVDLQTSCKRRASTFGDDEFLDHGALDFGYRLLMECEYLNDFLADACRVREEIDWLKQTVQEVKKKQSTILSEPLINDGTRKELDDLINAIKKMAKRIQEKLKDFKIEIVRAKKENPTSAEPRIRQMQYETLTRNFVEVMVECHVVQDEHRQRCKERFQRQLEIAGHSTSDEQLEKMLEENNPSIFTQEVDCGLGPNQIYSVEDFTLIPTNGIDGHLLIESETVQARKMLGDIEARHKDLLKLELSILELNSLFVDMSVLVNNQGDLIDRIAFNVENAVEFIGKAAKHTKKAILHQKRLRWKRIIIISVIAGVVIIIIVSIVASLKKS